MSLERRDREVDGPFQSRCRWGGRGRVARVVGLAAVVAIFGLGPGDAQSGAVTSSRIEICDASELGVDCSDQTVIKFSARYGEVVHLEAFAPGTGMATKLRIEKQRPLVRYPLIYRHTVNYYPVEEGICAPNDVCDDAPDSTSPTCGWAYSGIEKLEDSQGFCCGSVARCMRLGELWYRGYEIGRPIKSFAVDLEVIEGAQVHTASLSTTDRMYSTQHDVSYNGQLDLEATIEGELAGYEGIPDLSNHILYIASSPSSHPYVIDYATSMLLVPREQSSLDGGECNKVGVSFATFRSQEAHCGTREIGDCLHNQLFHKHLSDLNKLNMNPDVNADYLVAYMRLFKDSVASLSNEQKFLEFRPLADEPSLVSIVADLDTLRLNRFESAGVIASAVVDAFESMSDDGNLEVQIMNNGPFAADYVVSVENCNLGGVSAGIPQQSQVLQAIPFRPVSVRFDVYTTVDTGQSNQCTVKLKSTTGQVLSQTTVLFDTTDVSDQQVWDLRQENVANEEPVCVPEAGSLPMLLSSGALLGELNRRRSRRLEKAGALHERP
jgi:hypothetical protein